MIFSYLDGSDLISASQVSRPWQSFTSDNVLWRSVSRNAQVDLGLNARSLVDWRKQYCKWSKTESNLRNKKFSTQLIRARVSAVTFSQSTLLASGDGNIMSWRADGKQLLLEKDRFIPSTLVSCMQCSDDTYLVSTTNDKLILMETGREPRFWDHPATTTMIYSHPVVCMAFGHVLSLFDVTNEEKKCLYVMSDVIALAWYESDKLLVGFANCVSVYNWTSGARLDSFQVQDMTVANIQIVSNVL